MATTRSGGAATTSSSSRIEQRLERRLMRQVREIRVLASVEPVPRLYFNGALEMLVRAGQVAIESLHRRHRVMNMVGLRRQTESLLQMRPRLCDLARVEQRNAVGVVVFGRSQLTLACSRRRSHMAICSRDRCATSAPGPAPLVRTARAPVSCSACETASWRLRNCSAAFVRSRCAAATRTGFRGFHGCSGLWIRHMPIGGLPGGAFLLLGHLTGATQAQAAISVLYQSVGYRCKRPLGQVVNLRRIVNPPDGVYSTRRGALRGPANPMLHREKLFPRASRHRSGNLPGG